MSHEDIRNALLDETIGPIRTNDGHFYGVERWALGRGRLVILEGAGQHTLATRNIASIGFPTGRRRRRA